MEQNEISIQEVTVYRAMEREKKWMTAKEIAAGTGLPDRTVRSKTKKFVELGLADLAEVFPGHRYRISEKADKRNAAYVNRIEAAAEAFGL